LIRPLRLWNRGRELDLREAELPILSPRAAGRLEIEIGFGKGRYLVARAAEQPEVAFLGIESAPLYFRLANARAEQRGLDNLTTVCGDALYVLAACLDAAIADVVHVYFPDPWPKVRHRRRRLLDEATVDLVVGALRPGGVLRFATDHADYGAAVRGVLERHPALDVALVLRPWPDGPPTHYQTKYEREGRPILRLEATRRAAVGAPLLHPDGVTDVVSGAAPAPRR
jgi:tRNA (guanine-N7-)-methyltransferase